MKGDIQELAQPQPVGKKEGGPVGRRVNFSDLEPIKMSKAGMLSIKNVNYMVYVLSNIISLII